MMKHLLTSLFNTERDDIKVDDFVTINSGDLSKGIEKGMHGKVISINGDTAFVEINIGDSSKPIKDVEISSLYLVEHFDKVFTF